MRKQVSSFLRLRSVFIVLIALSALLVASCGSDSDGGGSETPLANLTPADSSFYMEVDLKPEGAKKADLEQAVSKLTGIAPDQVGDKLIEQINSNDDIDYKRDIEPWLGNKGAVYVSGIDPTTGDAEKYALIIESKDAGKAQEMIDSEEGTEDASYEGVDYKKKTDEDNNGTVIDKTVVIGNEAGLKAVIDASKGENLGGSDTFKNAVKDVQNEGNAYMYVDWSQLLEQLSKSSGGSIDPTTAAALQGALSNVPEDQRAPFAGYLSAESDKVIATITGPGTELESESESTKIAELPGNSLFAMSIPGYGKIVSEQLKESFGPQLDLFNQQLSATGLDLEKDLLSWMQDISAFVAIDEGDKAEDAYGALIISSSDPKTSEGTVKKLEKLATTTGQSVKPIKESGVSGFSLEAGDVPISLFATSDSVVIGVGKDIVKQVQSPSSQLADSKEFSAASEALAENSELPFMFADSAAISDLAKQDPGTDEQLIKVLDAMSYFAVGLSQDKDNSSVSLVGGLK